MDPKDTVKSIVANHFHVPVEEVRDDAEFVEGMGGDELDVVEMVISLEAELGVEVEDEDIVELKTVEDVVAYVEPQLEEN